MADERSYYHVNDFELGDCSVDEYVDGKRVDFINQLLQSGGSFSGAKEWDQYQQYAVPKPTEDKKPALPAQQIPSNTEAPATPQPPVISSPTTKPTKSLKHKCDTCSQVFDSRIALSIHVGRIHKSDGRDKSHQCPHCPKSFHNASYLSQHKRIHSGVKPYPCDMCSKRFTQLSHLQQHKRTHSGEKPYKCRQPGCTKAFSQLSNLQSHTRSHLPNVPKCTSCYKCFFDEKSLNAHMRSHTINKRVRNYTCEECGQRFTQDTYLQNHINKKHRAGAIEKPSFPPKALPSAQPTSIQAATSMICKVEDQGASPCTGPSALPSPLMQRVQSLSHPLMSNPLAGEQKNTGYAKDYGSEASYQRPAIVPPQFPSNTHDCESQQSGSAFKPPPIQRGVQQPMEVNQQRLSNVQAQGQQISLCTGYEQINNNILGLVATQDIKPPTMDRQQQQEFDMLSRLHNNMATAGIGPYSMFSSHMHQYMASSGGYPPSSYSSFVNSPLDSNYVEKIVDKWANGHSHADMLEDDSANDDYFMSSTFREAYLN